MPFRKRKRKSSLTNPFSVSDRDRFLRCYTLAGEAAMLIPSSPCATHHLDVSWDLWEEIKHEHFQTVRMKIFSLSQTFIQPLPGPRSTEHRQSCRTSTLSTSKMSGAKTKFRRIFRIRTTSSTIQQSPRQYPLIQYTTLESHLSAARTELYSKRSHWRSLCQYFPSVAV